MIMILLIIELMDNIILLKIEIHQFKECPMLIPCFKCNQICEISGLNEHYLKECQFKKEFTHINDILKS